MVLEAVLALALALLVRWFAMKRTGRFSSMRKAFTVRIDVAEQI
jgi:hypothetical protein